ncbi:MAG: PorV/PorQ family protein [bacterium]|nr:PorV/PorQ family protein [Candidatus Kapabacteria bacterium]
MSFVAVFALTTAPARAQLFPFLGGDRVGISAMAGLKIAPDARGAAMAGAIAATVDDASAAFWNPAALVDAPDGALLSYAPYHASTELSFASAHYAIDDENHIAVAAMRFGVPDMRVTTETQPFGTGQSFRARDVWGALSYARRFTDQFSAGLTLRFAEDSIAGLSARTLLVDAGTLYRTGLGSLRFAVSIQNFGAQIKPTGTLDLRADAGEVPSEYYPPTVFTIGFGYEIIDDSTQRLTSALALNHPNDNSENLALGLEYVITPIASTPLSLVARAGARVNADDEDFSFGAGLRLPPIAGASVNIDYAFTHYRKLSAVQRFSLGLAF